MRVYRRPRSAEFLLMAKQAALDTSWMNLGAEAFLYPFHQIRQSNGGFFLAHLANECEDRCSQINMQSSEAQLKGDISALLGRGHFYFALTKSGGRIDSGQESD
jgi:hypothetical protein